VFGKAEKMQDSDQRKDNADSSKQIAGLPVVRHKVAGIDLGSVVATSATPGTLESQ
jgi:hypothetical protein